MKYIVKGKCTNKSCSAGMFEVKRRSVTSNSTSTGKGLIQNVVCPECRTWGEVFRIFEVVKKEKVRVEYYYGEYEGKKCWRILSSIDGSVFSHTVGGSKKSDLIPNAEKASNHIYAWGVDSVLCGAGCNVSVLEDGPERWVFEVDAKDIKTIYSKALEEMRA